VHISCHNTLKLKCVNEVVKLSGPAVRWPSPCTVGLSKEGEENRSIGHKHFNTSSKVKIAVTTMLNNGYLAFSTECMYSVLLMIGQIGNRSAILNFPKYAFPTSSICSKFQVPMFTLSLVTIGRILNKWQQLFEIQDGGGPSGKVIE